MAYCVVLNSSWAVNRTIVNTPYNVIFTDVRLNNILPKDVSKFKLEAYVRTTNTIVTNVNARSLSVRVNIIPTNRTINQDMTGSTSVAHTITRNLPVASFETNQFSQTRTVINRPTNVSSIQVVFWDDNTNAQLVTASVTNMNWIMHLYFIPIVDSLEID